MKQPQPSRRGRLKVFLSYAAGAGKTYRMLEEARELKKQGADIVIGYFEPHGRKDTIEKTEGLEIIPRRKIEYRGTSFEEMDTEAILRRAPQICAVDEFPHTNVPGAERAKRWEDVMVLLDSGIDVMTTQVILSELGPDLSASFPSEDHFASWLELTPRRDVSGGKVIRHISRKSNNRVANALPPGEN